ncbi:NADPH-adrenodoxin reductase [Ascosphaera acerosa]|nr:NADPH-adrenodoxin reductase [Ascosphaera acerosa]
MARVADCRVDMYEKLPVPFGLVRYGVAPDHPEVKNCEDKFTEVAQSDNFRFIGNVEVGRQLPIRTLRDAYDAVLFTYGAPHDRQSGIAGSHLPGVCSARSFVGWYNGHPEHRHLPVDLAGGQDAIVVGNGNVALDVARILLADVDELRKTDIAEHALEQLSRSTVRRVRVVGRRGLMQASFTIKEVRELLRLPQIDFQPVDPALFPSPDVMIQLSRAQKRLVDLLASSAHRGRGASSSSSARFKSLSLDFLLQPVAFKEDPRDPTHHLRRAQLQKMQLDPATAHLKTARCQPAQDAQGPQQITIPADLAFTSIGYKSAVLQPFDESDLSLPFDEAAGHFAHDGHGRIMSRDSSSASETSINDDSVMFQPLPGLYCAGWVKNGPQGVIASTMTDAFHTAEIIASDWHRLGASLGGGTAANLRRPGWDFVRSKINQLALRTTSWKDWERVDQIERQRGEQRGKPREKIASVAEMLALLN